MIPNPLAINEDMIDQGAVVEVIVGSAGRKMNDGRKTREKSQMRVTMRALGKLGLEGTTLVGAQKMDPVEVEDMVSIIAHVEVTESVGAIRLPVLVLAMSPVQMRKEGKAVAILPRNEDVAALRNLLQSNKALIIHHMSNPIEVLLTLSWLVKLKVLLVLELVYNRYIMQYRLLFTVPD
jgi:hypothetical protein